MSPRNPFSKTYSPVCGLYYQPQHERLFLPQVQLQVQASIFDTAARVTLTQTFFNPSPAKAIREVKYVFPLYEGVSVVAFTCHVAQRLIVGEVKEKHEAKQDYTQAVARGETAGLFQQLDTSDTFMTTIGNVPPGARVDVNITYLGELKHDMQVDGTRFTIPTAIAPRYGTTAPGSDAVYSRYAFVPPDSRATFSMTVDVDMAEGSFIQKILSPSHPISVSLGTTSLAPNDDPKLTKASATLSLNSVHLDTDFILQIVAKHTGVPKAVLETHPTIPNQRALMTTLVPKFALPSEHPEIVFVCDRSGSMSYTNIDLAKKALQVFLKSLPVGVMFNICSFGTYYSFLWPRSVPYTQETLDQATAHVSSIDANLGGTEMLAPLKATIEQRYRDMPLEIMVLTDGSIWDQQSLFNYLNEQVKGTEAPIRVFSLGVGDEVSHALIEGLARAGNGFSQTVAQGENMDSKIVRMLKGALSPHVSDYALEVKYDGSVENPGEDDDFEIIDKVADSLKVKLSLPKDDLKQEPVSCSPSFYARDANHIPQARPISLFDPTVDVDNTNAPATTRTGTSRYAHLPVIQPPNILQAPQAIPPLFAFNRTTIYLLLGPDAPRQTPKSVVLRGTSAHGPLELELPVQVLDRPGETIHQLAVKKATYELEQGRGWLSDAKDEQGRPVKEQYEGRFSSMVEREAVRLGVQFQVAGKWCSFVAVEKKDSTVDREQTKDWEFLDDEVIQVHHGMGGGLHGGLGSSGSASQGMFSSSSPPSVLGKRHSLLASTQPAHQRGPFQTDPSLLRGNSSFGLGNGTIQRSRDADTTSFGGALAHSGPPVPVFGGGLPGKSTPNTTQSTSAGCFGSATTASRPPACKSGGLFGGFSRNSNTGGSLFGNSTNQPTRSASASAFGASNPPSDRPAPVVGGLFGGATRMAAQSTSMGLFGPAETVPNPPASTSGGLFGGLTSTQNKSSGLFGARSPASSPSNVAGGLFGNVTSSTAGTSGQLFGSSSPFTVSPSQSTRSSRGMNALSPRFTGFTRLSASSTPSHQQEVDKAKELQDYNMSLMLLEQQNKKRLLMARQEHDSPVGNCRSPPNVVEPDAALLQDYTREMQCAAAMPLPDENDENLGLSALDEGGALENFDFDAFLGKDGPVTASYSREMDVDTQTAQLSMAPQGFPQAQLSMSPPPSMAAPFSMASPPFMATQYGMTPQPSMAAAEKAPASASSAKAPSTDDEKSALLIKLQTFEGSWVHSPSLLLALQLDGDQVERARLAFNSHVGAGKNGSANEYSSVQWVTALTIVFFEDKLRGLMASWELVVDKARGWLEGQVGGDRLEELLSGARSQYKQWGR